MTSAAPRPDVGAVIREMVRRIVERFDPDKIILFGSRVRGDASADSDVDLLVVMPVRGRRLDAAVAIRQLLHGMGVSKDILVATPEEFEAHKDLVGTIVYPAVHEGRLLYDRSA